MRRIFQALPLVPAISMLALFAGCKAAPTTDTEGEETGGEKTYKTETRHTFEKYFKAAAEEHDVPADLLIALGYVETQLYHVQGDASEFDGIEPAYGPMALRGQALEQGSELSGIEIQSVQKNTESNIRAAAALLSAYADEMEIDREDLGAWAPAVAKFMGQPNSMAQSHYVHEEVYKALRDGISAAADSGMGDILAAHPDVTADFPNPQPYTSGYVPKKVYSAAIWRPSPSSNYTTGRGGKAVSLLVVHTCAGGYSGCWGWLNTPYPNNPYKTSAHYVINESGSQVSALVDEVDTAHHVGKPWQGASTNPRSVGIEHGGFSYQGANKWTEGQIATSAKVACDVVKRHNIIRDRQHIIGHYQPDPVNRANDPGKDFPWADYMNRIEMCVTGNVGGGGSDPDPVEPDPVDPGAGGGELVITVDSNDANNNATLARMVAASGNWKASSNVSGFWGSGYWVAPTQAVSDGAHFEFYMGAAGEKTIYAWWTAASDRSTSTPFVIFDAAGTKLGSVTKNQQTGGGAWQKIGTYNFTKGWNRVTVSRWTTVGYQVVADAIQVR
jgi:hypothetical protein